jgi:putative ABC transport system permease protein
MIDGTINDVRYALRLLWKSPLFTITAALSLAIGIGANTTIFSVASAILFRPLPGLSAADRLVDIGRTQDGQGFDTTSYPNYRDLRARTTTMSGVYAYRVEPEPMSLTENGNAERVYGTLVSGNYFDVLGSRPAAGRLLRDDDDRPEMVSPVAVISYELWQRRFALDPALLGAPVKLNGTPFTIVGVAPKGFQGTTLLKPDVWVPMALLTQAMPRMPASLLTSRQSVWLILGGRLKPGVTTAQANAEAAAIGAALEREFPRDNRGKNFAVKRSALVPGEMAAVGGFMALLMAIVGLVLMVACVNVAGMMLARAAARRREIAVRMAIGAGRWRLMRQMLTEALVLFACGAAAGLMLSHWLTALLFSFVPQLPVPVSVQVQTDWRVLSFAVATSFVAAVLSGLAPALQASSGDLIPALKTESTGGGSHKLRLRNAFVVAQIAMSLVLIVGAGLFLRALQHAATIQPGFDARNVDVVSLDLSMAGYKKGTGEGFARELLTRIAALPSVESASLANDLPLNGNRFGLGDFRVPGFQPPSGQDYPRADWDIVEPGYFRTLRMPIIRGRDFDAHDSAAGPLVAIVNAPFVTRFWPGQDGLGKQIEVDRDNAKAMMTIVGVTGDARLVDLTEAAEPMIYVPMAQNYIARVNLVIRTADGRPVANDVRTILRSMNPNLPITEASTLEQVTALTLVPQRVAAAVAGSLGLVALLLAAIGIYGVTAYAVSRRTREIGIRIALGADRRAVMALVLRQGLVLAVIGVAIGVVVAAAGSQVVESLLVGVRGLDAIAFVGSCVVFAVVSIVATYVPARRAIQVEPTVALRND